MATQFGSPKQAANLIRKAKRRNRPLWWQLWRLTFWAVVWGICAAILIYAGLSLRFYLGRPDVAHNYWQEINQARRVDESQRAWPIYREVLFKLGKDEMGAIDVEDLAGGPETEKWKQSAALVDRRHDEIARIREGAAKPSFGWYLGDPAEAAAIKQHDAKWLGEVGALADENKQLISASLYSVQVVRVLARLLAIDARVAATRGEGTSAAADLMALVGLSEQLFVPDGTLVEQLVGISIFGQAMDTLGHVLADSPAVLSDEQLLALRTGWRRFERETYRSTFAVSG